MNNFRSSADISVTDLQICHVNCQSLFAHIDEFRLYFMRNFYHVICLSETWLRGGMHSDMVSLPGYFLLRCDREGRNGGGVGVYVHESLWACRIEDSGGGVCRKTGIYFC